MNQIAPEIVSEIETFPTRTIATTNAGREGKAYA